MRHRNTLIGVVGCALLVCITGVARGQDLSRDTIPGKWIEPLLPENLPKLELPAYAKDLDRARAEAFTGRFKKSLRTLAKVKDADPAEVAIIRATSLAALGNRDDALKALSDPSVVDQPRVQVRRAELLADMGRLDEAVVLLKQHVAKNPDSITGHYYLGAISERAGDLETAKDAYAWFTAEPQN